MFDAAILTNVVLGVVQGLTEFLPISSSGHLILVHELFGAVGEADLAFDALLHFATVLAIIVYFWRDIKKLLQATLTLPRKIIQQEVCTSTENMVVALVVGTIPAVILGLLLEDIMATLFRNPLLVAGSLMAGSLVMFIAERALRARTQVHALGEGWQRGLVLGFFQSLALIPGMSRSGMTISGGMLFGMTREEAARFGFLLGVPVLLGAGAKKAIELGLDGITIAMLCGVIAAFVVALLVIHYLLKFLRTHSLNVFIGYRVLLALGIVIVVLV